MNRHRTDITVEDLGNGIFRLNEYDFANCFLVLGTEKACLIDTCAGIADIGAVVRGITSLPVTVLITHAHADHIGGAVWFPEAYIHPADYKRGKQYFGPAARMYFLYCHKYKKKKSGAKYSDCFQREFKPQLKTAEEGSRFSLGDREIEAFHTPGHSVGSLVFKDSKTGIVFTGDNVNPMVTLQFPGAVTVREWIDGANKTLDIAGTAPMWGGHGNLPIERATVETAIALAKEIVAEGNQKGSKTCKKAGEEKYPCIYYKANRVI